MIEHDDIENLIVCCIGSAWYVITILFAQQLFSFVGLVHAVVSETWE